MKPFDFLIVALAVYRLSLMITKEKGPGWMFVHLRRLVKRNAPKESHMDEGIDCLWCMSMQISMAMTTLAWFFFPTNPICAVSLYSLAASGVAIIINQAFTKG